MCDISGILAVIAASPTAGLWRLLWEHNGETVTKVDSPKDLCNPLYSDNCTTSYYTLVNYPGQLLLLMF